jgi:hypothetical protein
LETTGLWQLESLEQFADKGICAVYKFKPFISFTAYTDKLNSIEWWSRLGEILKFAQSLAKALSAIHQKGVFRAYKLLCSLTLDGHISPSRLDIDDEGRVIINDWSQAVCDISMTLIKVTFRKD